jgi:hypothetical protein
MASCDQPHLICEDYLVILYIWTNILNKINSQTQLKKLIAAMEKMTDIVQSTRLLDPQMQLRIWDPACHETIEAHGSSLLGSCWYVFLGLLWIQWPRNKKEAEKLAVAAKKKGEAEIKSTTQKYRRQQDLNLRRQSPVYFVRWFKQVPSLECLWKKGWILADYFIKNAYSGISTVRISLTKS